MKSQNPKVTNRQKNKNHKQQQTKPFMDIKKQEFTIKQPFGALGEKQIEYSITKGFHVPENQSIRESKEKRRVSP